MSLKDLPDFYLIRHGETEWNREGRYQGQRDIPLNPTGKKQAEANGHLLRELFARDGIDPDSWHWRASPMTRVRQTVSIVRTACGLPEDGVTFDERLREISFGVFEGELAVDLLDGDHEFLGIGHRDEAFWAYTPTDGESYQHLADRITPVLAELTGPSVIVAHGGVARICRYLVEDITRVEAVNWPIRQDAIMFFSKGRMTIYPSGDPGAPVKDSGPL